MKQIIKCKEAPAAIGPYSQAVETNGMLYISGQIPLNDAGEIKDSIKEQTEQVLINLGHILKEAGYDYSDVVKTTCLLSDMKNFKAMNEVYTRYFTQDAPARAAFAVKELPLGALIEIDAIAIK